MKEEKLVECSKLCFILHDKFYITQESTGGYSSMLNGKAKKHIHTSKTHTLAYVYDSGYDLDKWCFASEHDDDVYNATIHDAHNEQPEFIWSGTRIFIHDL